MKERPIIFNAPMVRAILAGAKTQTRRLVKPQPYADAMGNACWKGSNFGQSADKVPHFQSLASPLPSSKTGRVRCPYGQPGDRLWVRETWRIGSKWDAAKPSSLPPRAMTVEFEAGGYGCNGIGGEGWAFHDAPVRERPDWVGKLRPGMFMPRWASRITLEVTNVRVERLQDISVTDAIAEGVTETAKHLHGLSACLEHCYAYQDLWESINGPGSWDANPWVWVIEFRRVHP